MRGSVITATTFGSPRSVTTKLDFRSVGHLILYASFLKESQSVSVDLLFSLFVRALKALIAKQGFLKHLDMMETRTEMTYLNLRLPDMGPHR
jgi:hypothetical protein